MARILGKLALCTIIIGASHAASAGTVVVAKQTHSQEGLIGVTANQTSNSIEYVVGADYAIDDVVTFTFPSGALISPSFPDPIAVGAGSLALDSSSPDSATYRVTAGISADDTIAFGRIGYRTAAVMAGALTVTVSSYTAAGEVLDLTGIRTAVVAEVKSQFGRVEISSENVDGEDVFSVFDGVIQNDTGQDGISFATADTVLTWEAINPTTTGWLNLATVFNTNVTISGQAGKMTGLGFSDFITTTANTKIFSEAHAQLSLAYNGMVPSGGAPESLTFTPPGDVVLEEQSFKFSFSYYFQSAGAVEGTTELAVKVNAGEWALSTPVAAPASSVVLSGSVAMAFNSNTQNGAFCDLDNVLDPGETSTMTVTLRNSGTGLVSGVTAQVSSTADVTFSNGGVLTFDDIASARFKGRAMIDVTLNAATLNEPVNILVTFMSDDPDVVLPAAINTALNVNSDYVHGRATDDFSTTNTIWLDWSRSQSWAYNNSGTFGTVMLGPNSGSESDIRLKTPTLTVADTGAFSMDFEHHFEFETGTDGSPWDGGVIEISVDGGDWMDVVDAGGTFATGYNGTIASSNPSLGGRDGFVGELVGGALLATESISFPEGNLNGIPVQFRFRIGTDASVSARGWSLDNVSFTNMTDATPFSVLVVDSGVCENRAPFLLDVMGVDSVVEGSAVTLTAQGLDHDPGDITYIWTQTAGASPINTWDIDATSTTFTFNAPKVAADETYSFSVQASDGELLSPAQQITMVIINNADPVLTTGQSSVSVVEWESVVLIVSGSDAEDDALTYAWTMNGVVLDATGPSYQYTAPGFTEGLTASFSVTASDSTGTSEAIPITVRVNPAPKSSGGGSLGLWVLLLFPIVFIRRKKAV